jgi:hypothetical protein
MFNWAIAISIIAGVLGATRYRGNHNVNRLDLVCQQIDHSDLFSLQEESLRSKRIDVVVSQRTYRGGEIKLLNPYRAVIAVSFSYLNRRRRSQRQ